MCWCARALVRAPNLVRIAKTAPKKVGGDVELLVCNVHLDATTTHQYRIAQLHALIPHLDEHQHLPCVIIGDYNAEPDSPIAQLLDEFGFSMLSKKGAAKTWPSGNPTWDIDHISYRSSEDVTITGEEVRVVDDRVASDHCPIITTIALWSTY